MNWAPPTSQIWGLALPTFCSSHTWLFVSEQNIVPHHSLCLYLMHTLPEMT